MRTVPSCLKILPWLWFSPSGAPGETGSLGCRNTLGYGQRVSKTTHAWRGCGPPSSSYILWSVWPPGSVSVADGEGPAQRSDGFCRPIDILRPRWMVRVGRRASSGADHTPPGVPTSWRVAGCQDCQGRKVLSLRDDPTVRGISHKYSGLRSL